MRGFQGVKFSWACYPDGRTVQSNILFQFWKQMAKSTTEVEMTQEVLSQCLYQTLEIIGVSMANRNMQKERAIATEIIESLVNRIVPCYICGSQYEGTSLPNMGSDIDKVLVMEELEVITSLQDCPNKSLLLIQEDLTPPGYCKLQLVLNGVPVYMYHCDNNPEFQSMICKFSRLFKIDTDGCGRKLCGRRLPESFKCKGGKTQFHGPALQLFDVNGQSYDVDLVYAFRGRYLPKEAIEWFTRKRLYGWPRKDIIEKCRNLGFFVVPVGHPKSKESDKEWRLSLTLQERMLITMFNSVQLKCFVVMKVLKNEVINQKVGKKILTSYHCKTCMLYMIETTQRDFWIPPNLLKCISACLEKLCQWTKKRYCPNYFIPKENMFDKLESEDLELLANVLKALLKEDIFSVLLSLGTANIGFNLRMFIFENLQQDDIQVCEHGKVQKNKDCTNRIICEPGLCKNLTVINLRRLICQLRLISNFMINRSHVLENTYSRNHKEVVENLQSVVDTFESITKVTEHSEEETKTALSLFLPVIKPILMCARIALLRRSGTLEPDITDILNEYMGNISRLTSDSFQLKKSSILHVLGHLDESLHALRSIPGGVRESLCSCDIEYTPDVEALEVILRRPDMTDGTTKDDIWNVISPCIPFLPTEAHITPPVIIYECLRYLCLPPKPSGLSTEDEYQHEIAFVDGSFIHPFLLYMNHSELIHQYSKLVDILLMNAAVNTRQIGHKASCLNILGWVFKREGLKSEALECFIQSIREESECNAAYWHLLFLICE